MTATTGDSAPAVQSVLDNFVVVIGAQRCGSTLLHRMLDSHPQISMLKPARPEPKVFLRAGLTSIDLRTWVADHRVRFDPGATVFGEKSTSYLESPVAAATIKRLVPRARVIAIVRDPIERAVSNYRFSRDNGLESDTIEVALERELTGQVPGTVAGVSVSPFAYLGRGRYAEHLQAYDDLFGPDRLRVVVLEQMVRQPESIRSVFAWLGVDESIEPHRVGPVNATDGRPPALPAALRSRLENYFRRPNRHLADRYGIDISPWS